MFYVSIDEVSNDMNFTLSRAFIGKIDRVQLINSTMKYSVRSVIKINNITYSLPILILTFLL